MCLFVSRETAPNSHQHKVKNCCNVLDLSRKALEWQHSYCTNSSVHVLCLFIFAVAMSSEYLLICIVILVGNISYGKNIEQKRLRLKYLTTCTYDFEVSVNAARGAQSTASDGCQLHALVRVQLFKCCEA